MKYLIFLFFFQVSAEMIFSQKMVMSHMNQPGRNVFLGMMDTMMVQMETVLDSASVESNFMSQMIPHHQGAVAMANYEIKNGKNFETIQLAKSILTEQEEEIHLMQLWLGRPSNIHYKETLPDGYRLSMKKSMEIMMSDMPPDSVLCDIDLAFSRVMIPHHQAAVEMAKAVLRYPIDRQTELFAQHIISSQEVEIEQMTAAIKH